LDIQEIAKTLERAILDLHLRVQAQKFNDLVQNNYNRIIIKQKIIRLYEQVGSILKLNTLHNNFFAKRSFRKNASFNQ
jgi:hypothetical protein